MSRISLAMGTPCPAPTRPSHLPTRRLSVLDNGDDTAQVEYTRVIQQEFKHARPRRPGRPKADKYAGMAIFEDVPEGEELVVKERDRSAADGSALGGVLLAKKAQRRVPGVKAASHHGDGGPLKSLGQARGRGVAQDDEKDDWMLAGVKKEEKKKSVLQKDPRRRTIFVPSDDTTIMTIHPGANDTHKLDDTFQMPHVNARPLLDFTLTMTADSPDVPKQPTRRPRMSLAAAPKRMPLEHIDWITTNIPAIDVAGEKTGKENELPRDEHVEMKKADSFIISNMESLKPVVAKSRLFEQTAASQARQSVVPRKAVPMSRPRADARSPVLVVKPRTTHRPASVNVDIPVKPIASQAQSSPGDRRSPNVDRKERSSKVRSTARPNGPQPPWKASSSFVSAADASRARLQAYSTLSEDIARPELYEESWLNHQEIALTEVINQIFAKAEPSKSDQNTNKNTLRDRLISIYHQPEVATLHKRLQASLSYGALSKPKEIPSAPTLTQDLGLRKRFISLWLDSYRLDVLSAAAEVVVGRRIATPAASPASSTKANNTSLDTKQSRRSVIRFLETFFVSVDDASSSEDSADGLDLQTQRRNKTVLRSIMLVWLLDQAATLGASKSCLLKTRSAHKSSASVLNALASMLIPSVGDIGRVLRHFDYSVNYTQDPLDEVVYKIENLAVDLRDGVILTRLVELLLYTRPQLSGTTMHGDANETVTIVLPDTTVLESTLFDKFGVSRSRVLSQHLKMPCLGHAQKAYNLEIALSALRSHPRTATLVSSDVIADTILEGHRERTLSLLWSLVSCVGIDILLDRHALITDIAQSSGCSDDALALLDTSELLQRWAAGYCTSRNLSITNLTTSFADGKAYAAIVSAFTAFLPSSRQSKSQATDTEGQLHSLGCSTAFTKQLASTTQRIPSRETTLANVIFLASRLLPLARQHRAAVTIQRACRLRQARTVVSQRVKLMRLADDCAQVVRGQQRIAQAATLVQRAWRRIMARRIERLERDVVGFQVVARGWALRKGVARRKREDYARSARMEGLGRMGRW